MVIRDLRTWGEEGWPDLAMNGKGSRREREGSQGWEPQGSWWYHKQVRVGGKFGCNQF